MGCTSGFERRLVTTLMMALDLIVVYAVLLGLRQFPYTSSGESRCAGSCVTVENLGLGIVSPPGLFTMALILLITRFLIRRLGSVQCGRARAYLASLDS